jgi:hypothetical protein
MRHACVRCSLQSGRGHTLCCAEPPWMYILRENQDIRTTKQPEWILVTHPVDHPLQIHQPALHVLYQRLCPFQRGIAYQGPGLGHKLAG